VGLFRTNDAGFEWFKIPSPSNFVTITLDKILPERIYAAYYNSRYDITNIYKSTDNAVSWQKIKEVKGSFCYNIIFENNILSTIYNDASTSFPMLLKSTDRGVSWSESVILPFEASAASFAVDPNNNDFMFASLFYNNNGFVIKTIDGGNLWNTIYQPADYNKINNIFIDPQNSSLIYLATYKGTIRSSDAGYTWHTIDTNECKEVYVDKNGIIYSSCVTRVIVSLDGGSTWKTYKEGLTSKTNCMAVDETNNMLYVGTEEQGILTLNLNTATHIREKNEKPLTSFNLYQNYPNPFNQSTGIRFQLKEFGTVKLGIYNTLGQLITTLMDEEKQPGEYNIIWNGKNIRGRDVPSGIYFYKLSAGSFTEVKKMILLR